MPNPVVFFEILGRDKAALESFYAGLFEWQMTPANSEAPDTYAMVSTGRGISGGIGKSMDGGPGHVTFYVEVENIQDALSRVESRGGKRVLGPEPLPNGPVIALFTDPEGRVVGLVEAANPRSSNSSQDDFQ
ncbi:VOC family protein [Occallatibacter riparius]|uniref:VOC family protein n=1 Tax=Occallatibacter riparius TaxID=1002689 RepID=A0A9J7BUE1_9BACT|nr:VOC family protein [Occallatibacter riparius]UWZ86491.1 VOC family protein [Occallatibacter riparius]